MSTYKKRGCIKTALLLPFKAIGYAYLFVLTLTWSLIKLPFSHIRKKKSVANNGVEYEHLVAKYLKSNGYHNVSVTQASGDFGADVIAHKAGVKYAVQCKLYGSPVGVSAVQEVVAAKAHYKCTGAIVVTNNRFTSAAEKLAKENDVILLSNITSSGSISTKTLSVLVKVALFAVYAFFASALLVVSIKATIAKPTISNICSIPIILTVIFSPLWFPPLCKYIYKNLKKKSQPSLDEDTLSSLECDQTMSESRPVSSPIVEVLPTTRNAVASASSLTKTVNEDTISSYLKQKGFDISNEKLQSLCTLHPLDVDTVRLRLQSDKRYAADLIRALLSGGYITKYHDFNFKYQWVDLPEK